MGDRWKMSNTRYRIRGAVVVLGGILVHLSIGTYFTFGNISPYLISYLRNRTDDTELRNVDGLWISAIGGIGNCVGMSTGGILDKRFGPRIATAVGSALFSASIALTSLTIRKAFVYVIITYGVTQTLGLTMAYGPPVQTSIKWFPNHPSLAAGLIVAGFGGGALIFNQVITNYINPDNLAPDLTTDDGEKYFTDPDLLDRIPTCLLILTACYVGMQVIGLLMITTPPRGHHSVTVEVNPEQNGMTNIGFCENEKVSNQENIAIKYEKELNGVTPVRVADRTGDKENVSKETEYTAKEAILKMFKTRSSYVLWVTLLGLDTGMQFIVGLYKAYGQTFIEDDHFLALVGSISSAFNCIGRPLWGLFMDRFGYKMSMGFIAGGLSIMFATLFTTEYMGKPGFFIWICLTYVFFCGIWAVIPSTLAKLFGSSNMAINYGFIEIAISLSHVLGGVFAITLKELIGWRGLFFLAGGIGVIPFILTFFFNGKDRTGKRI